MIDLIVVAILVVVLGAAIRYIVKSKKSGSPCIGCSACSGCMASDTEKNTCGCGTCSHGH